MRRKIVIVGAGQAGCQVATSLRQLGHAGPIAIVGDEPYLPYQRPPLSKAFLKGGLSFERLYLNPASFYAERNIEVVTNARVASIDLAERRLTIAGGSAIAFDVLVLAMGTRARMPPIEGLALGNVFTVRGIADAEKLRQGLDAIRRIAVVGGGYIGLEVAAILRGMGKGAVLLETQDRILARVTSPPISDYFDRLHRAHGVEIVTGARVRSILGDARTKGIALHDGRILEADAVLLAVGAAANDEIAAAAGIATDDGILVDPFGHTSASDVYACGDCARFASARYRRSVRIESVQNAIDQAKSVAATIMGRPTEYDPVPWFWSDQYDTRLQIAGLFSGEDGVHIAGDPAGGKFSAEYRHEGRLTAVDTINDARAHMLARRRITEAESEHRSAAHVSLSSVV